MYHQLNIDDFDSQNPMNTKGYSEFGDDCTALLNFTLKKKFS